MRCFPLPVLGACTCAVLLVGCESPVEPYQVIPPPPPQSVSAEISGPSRIDKNGAFSWEAFAFGGSGEFRYRWEVTRQVGQPTTTTLERKLSLLVAGTDGDLVLSLTVTSGGETYVQSFAVRNCIGGCPPAK